MKTNEDFIEWFKEANTGFIEKMIPESQPEYYLRKGFFAHNDELELMKDKIKELEEDMEYVASLILSTGYTEENGKRIMDGNEYMWIDAAVVTLRKYHKRNK